MSYVDLNCSQDSAQFPEDAPPTSSPPDYGATDLRMRDPEFHRRTLGATSGGPPPPAQHTSTGGKTQGKPTPKPVDLSLAGRKPSSKPFKSKSTKNCPYCSESSENLRRHAYGVHVPWYMDPTRVCWTCLQSFKQPSLLEAHRAQCGQGQFQAHAAAWAPRVTNFFRIVAQELSLPSMEELVPFIKQHLRFLPKPRSPIDKPDLEVMKLYELNRQAYPSGRTYRQDPPNCLAALIQWRIIGGLLSLVSSEARTQLMDAPAVGTAASTREDPPPAPRHPPPARLPPPPPKGPPPETAARAPASTQKLFRITSHTSSSAPIVTEVRQLFRAASSPATPLMSLKVSPTASLSSDHTPVTAPPPKTRIVEATSGAALQVSIPGRYDPPPPLEDASPVPEDVVVVPPPPPPPYLAADAHCHLQQLVGSGEKRYTSLEAALNISVPHPLRVDPIVPSYCWPNTWEDILQVRPRAAKYSALGWHPTQAAQYSPALLRDFRRLLKEPDVVAVGEVGLDYDRIQNKKNPRQEEADRQQQKELLEVMCREAKSHCLPIVIHCRDPPQADSASQDCLAILGRVLSSSSSSPSCDWPIYLHCFNYGLEVALRWASTCPRVHFGISPVLLNPRRRHPGLQSVVCNIPREKILIETDSPYLPVPQTAAKPIIPSPVHVYQVAQELTTLRDEDSVQDVLMAAREATMRFYRIL